MANKIETNVAEMAEPIANDLGIEIVDVEYLKEGADWYLRIYIDKDGGVGIDDCEALSRLIDTKLDETLLINQAYILEVSSPGVERQLKREKDYLKFLGREVNVKLFKPIDGQKQFKGILKGCEDGRVTIDVGGKESEFLLESIASTKLNFDFGALS